MGSRFTTSASGLSLRAVVRATRWVEPSVLRFRAVLFLVALLFFAGLQTIPKAIYEAAAIDGATERRIFWSITLPLLRPVLVFVLVTTIIGSFQIFDTIAVTTGGGPIDATRVITWYIFEFAFQRFQMGYATAVSVVLFLILIVATLLQMRILRADESDLA